MSDPNLGRLMRIAIEGHQLTEVNFHQLLDAYKQTNSQNTIINHNHRIPLSSNLFHEILGGGWKLNLGVGGGEVPGRPYLCMKTCFV